jgi:CDP-glycerol glycerophosphotransferase (TagB/SpsB family)
MKNYYLLQKNLIKGSFISRKIKVLLIIFVVIRNYLIKLLLAFFSFFIPKNNKILLFSSVGNYDFPIFLNEDDYQFKESPKYLAIYSAKNFKNFKSYFHCPNKNLFKSLEEKEIIPVRGVFSFWVMLRAKYLFIDNNNFFNPNPSFLFGRFNFIQCWHGTPLKKMGEDILIKKRKFSLVKKIEENKYDMVVSNCPYSSKIFKKLFSSSKILETGYPRNDIFKFPDFFSIEKLKEKINLNKYNKIFLYAPTFRKLKENTNPFSGIFLKKINDIMLSDNSIFLIKQHPYASSIEGLDKFSRIIDISEIVNDIQEVLIYTDILITDYSSVFFDYSLLNKPMIFFAKDLDDYDNDRGLYLNYRKEMPGPIIENDKEFLKLLNNYKILYSKNNINKIRIFKNKFNKYQDGKNCERLFKKLLREK